MKKILSYITALFILACACVACKKMDSTYKNFIVPNGLVYTAKPTSPIVYSGRNRVKIAWLRGADPNVTRARIFWNNYADSVNVPIPATGDTISVIISNLEERPYTFIAKTYDDKGNTSVPIELLGESFGTNYDALLLARPIAASEIDESGVLAINWGNANISGGAYATDVEYTDVSSATKVKRFPIAEMISTISDYKLGTTFRYRTVYNPGSRSIDLFSTGYRTEYVARKIPKAGLAVTTDSFAATSQLPLGGPVKFVFDDDVNTYWHTHHTAPVPTFPHWFVVDLAKTYTITRVELTSRPGVTNGFTTFNVDGSMDGTNFTTYGSFTKIPKDPAENFIITGSPKMRYIRIYATAGAAVHTNLAEFTVFGY
jgi:hypothetical protein